jgi:hypothetical protein
LQSAKKKGGGNAGQEKCLLCILYTKYGKSSCNLKFEGEIVMSKKCICLISLVFLLGMAGNVLAAVTYNQYSGPANGDWNTAGNWALGHVPTTAEKAGAKTVGGPLVVTSTPACGEWTLGGTAGGIITINSGGSVSTVTSGGGTGRVSMGQSAGENGTLNMNGGTATFAGILDVGYAGTGHINLSAGTVTTPDNFYVGFNGKGYVQMTGGSITVGLNFGIAKNTGSIADVNLYGGTITVNGTFTMSSGGGMDITTGTLIINGDVTTLVTTYINNGWITGYGGAGTVNVSYNTPNAGKTTVTASSSALPGQAANPSPANGATGVNTTADLSWTAGSGATSHDVYFGTTSPGTSRGNQTATTYDTGTMANSTTYYWRIDEKNAAGTTTGVVWSFTTAAAPQPPGQAANPSPATGATNVSATADLSWTVGSGATSHDVYFGTTSPGTFRGNQTATTYDTGTMTNSTTYYWRIDEKNAVGTTTGVVWSFTTESAPPPPALTAYYCDVDAMSSSLPMTVDGNLNSKIEATSSQYTAIASSDNSRWQTLDPGSSDEVFLWLENSITEGNITSIDLSFEGYLSNSSANFSIWARNVANSRWDQIGTTQSIPTGSDGTITRSITSNIGDYVSGETLIWGVYESTSSEILNIDYVNVVVNTSEPQPPGQASNPSPTNGATSVSTTADLSWTAGSGTTSHDVYFGTTSPGTLQGNQTATTFDTGTMANSTTYYWRIDEKNAVGTTTGVVWSFTTAAAPPPPGQASNPNPANGATSVSITADLSWTAGSGATSHDVYFGTTSPGTFRGNQTATTYDTGTMAYSTTYYWRIDEKNAVGTTTGVVWSFTTAATLPPPGQATTPNPANAATGIGVTNDLSWTAGSNATSHDVYFGTTSPGTLRGNQTATTYDTGTMAYSTTYYWRIDEKNAAGTTTGVIWSFTTAAATGVDRNWTNANGNRLWTTAANWSGSVVPTGADKAAVRGNYVTTGPIIQAGMNAVANTVVVGDWSSTAGDSLDMTGGTLTVNSWCVFGYGPLANHGTFTISAGTVNVNDPTLGLYIGNTGVSIGTLDMTGGTINVTATFGIAQVAGSTGTVYLDGGTITCGALNMTTNGRLDITTGTLIVNGDARTLINTYIANGWLTGYGGSGTMNVDYNVTNPGKTTVTSTPSLLPGKAANPNPAAGATGVATTNDLSWTAGSGATSHNVYFGTTSPGTSRGNQTATTYDTGTMANTTTYYWRIDEQNANGITTGTVWSFTTQGTVVVNRLKGPYLIYPNNNTQMTVLWQVDVTAGCTIAWGTDTSYSTGNAGTTEYGTASNHQHKYNITGLTPGTHYYYRVTGGSNNWTGDFYAAPAATATNVKFFMYGDTRTWPSQNNLNCGGMISTYNADAAYQTMVLLAGDWVNSNSESDWTTQWFNYSYPNIATATANMSFQGSMGNHEGSGTVYVKYWPYPYVAARYWSFDYGPVHVAVVDQYTTYTSGSAQYNWLVNDLSSSTKLWKIILLHEPGWSCAAGHGNNTTVQSTIQPLCTQYGVSIVVGGHNHYFARAVVEGVQHITSGAGGADAGLNPTLRDPVVVCAGGLSFQKVAISGNTLTCITRRPDGTVLDTFTVTK